VFVKVAFASTEDQIEKIEELVQYMYQEVFPTYFTDRQILDYKSKKVLYLANNPFKQVNTLKDGYQIISSLQTIISILELKRDSHHYEQLFQFNKYFLEQYDIYFPFEYEQFTRKTRMSISMFEKAANDLLI